MADYPADVILDGSPVAPHSPEDRSHGDSRRSWGDQVESEAVESLVTHELDPQRGRSTPGLGLPAEELDWSLAL